jgi:hypothetical protein
MITSAFRAEGLEVRIKGFERSRPNGIVWMTLETRRIERFTSWIKRMLFNAGKRPERKEIKISFQGPGLDDLIKDPIRYGWRKRRQEDENAGDAVIHDDVV